MKFDIYILPTYPGHIVQRSTFIQKLIWAPELLRFDNLIARYPVLHRIYCITKRLLWREARPEESDRTTIIILSIRNPSKRIPHCAYPPTSSVIRLTFPSPKPEISSRLGCSPAGKSNRLKTSMIYVEPKTNPLHVLFANAPVLPRQGRSSPFHKRASICLESITNRFEGVRFSNEGYDEEEGSHPAREKGEGLSILYLLADSVSSSIEVLHHDIPVKREFFAISTQLSEYQYC